MSELRDAYAWVRAWGRAALFASAAAAAAMSLSAYTARTRALAMRQIYFNAWHVLPGFTLFMALLSWVVIRVTIGLARDYGLAQFALELVFRAVVFELIPLLAAFYVALRSGAAIVTEVAMMRVSGELDELFAAHLDPYEREFVPRIAAAAISVFALTIVSCTVVMGIAYLVMYGANPSGLDEYARTVARVFSPWAIAGFMLKSFLFGAAVAVIPIAAGLDATRDDPASVPEAVMGGMVRLFVTLALIELLSLAVKYV
jgi:phospholipid/cholesterol/gamma-HCH transport system permease protein